MSVEHQDARANITPTVQWQLRTLVVRKRDSVAWQHDRIFHLASRRFVNDQPECAVWPMIEQQDRGLVEVALRRCEVLGGCEQDAASLRNAEEVCPGLRDFD
jgi:hypothetical protein